MEEGWRSSRRAVVMAKTLGLLLDCVISLDLFFSVLKGVGPVVQWPRAIAGDGQRIRLWAEPGDERLPARRGATGQQAKGGGARSGAGSRDHSRSRAAR